MAVSYHESICKRLCRLTVHAVTLKQAEVKNNNVLMNGFAFVVSSTTLFVAAL